MRPVFDPAAVVPELTRLHHAAVAGDWQAIDTLFAEEPDPYGIVVLADTLSEIAGVEQLLGRVLEYQPHNLLATALLAGRHTHLAWDARTDAPAKGVTPEGWAGFRAHLNQAEQLLIRATALDPGHALAWTMRITTAMGLSLGQSESERRYRNLAKASPSPYGGQRNRLQQLLPKWGGSWEAAHAFAQACLREAPPGGLGGAIVAMYHVDRWSSFAAQDRPEYLRRPQVRQELAEAAASVLHPACRARYGFITAHSMFAMLASLADDQRAAAAHFRAMGPYGHTYPWALLGGDAEAVFTEHRDRALAQG
ncbi:MULTISPECIES: hypothetical protein [Kitasatospora]|uniref:DUF4034 domain-containing protein n=1 Tax=Kitasatospora cystarginea TaxID=58350 RepID=A0ABN3E7V9_9ACTN